MARKQKPIIKGSDPEYTSELAALPTNKPPSKPEPVQEAITPEPTATEKPATPVQHPAPRNTTAKPKVNTVNTDLGDKREIALSAAVKVDQNDKLATLESKGISAKDAITMAGRRAVDQFNPKPIFVEKADAQRMPMRQGYKSTKRLDAAMLDQLRDEHDPLRLSSDGAMMRGQFEPLFWSCLDAVIDELNSKY